MKNPYTRLSRKLSFILRHHPEKFNISMDKQGWCLVKDIVAKGTLKITANTLFDIVKTDDKGRYQLSEDRRKIRALQGHSIPWLEMEFEDVTSENMPQFLYHGTSNHNFQKIMDSLSILSMSRQYVHLSPDVETAKKVAGRHGNKMVIITIDAHKLENLKCSLNNVYLVKDVPISSFVKYEFL